MKMAKRPRKIPKGINFVTKVFDKAILSEPDGIVVRKATVVERQASEALLVAMAASKGFVVTRFGSHYAIHRKEVEPFPIKSHLSK